MLSLIFSEKHPACRFISLALFLFLIPCLVITVQAQEQPPTIPMRIEIDATQVTRRLVHSHVQMPVTGDSVTVSYPLWAPGDHAPIQQVGRIGNLIFHAGARTFTWRRDLVDADAFHVTVPAGTTWLEADFDFLLPAAGDAFADASSHIFMLRWITYTIYLKGKAVSDIPVVGTVVLPKDWQLATALPVGSKVGDTYRFQQTSLDTLVDSPVLAGQYMRKIDLTPGRTPLHELDIAAESEVDLPPAEEIAPKFKRLIQQTKALFGTEHYRSYHFLVMASDYTMPGAGFEHQESSDNRVPSHLNDPMSLTFLGRLLSHEYVHSWNGKYRRPADLYTSDYQQPEQTDLLWVYESLTEYLSVLLTSRSGFRSEDEVHSYLASLAARVDHETGRTWRNMQDTTDSAPVTMNELFFDNPGWGSWLRMLDYYDEGVLLWLEVDEKIIEQTHGQHSLLDFLKLFYGGEDGFLPVRTYTEQDITSALNQVAPGDWKSFFQKRLTSHAPHAPLDGLERSGWKLVYTSVLGSNRPGSSTMYSIGIAAGADGTISDILRGGPADLAGCFPGMKIVTVNGQPWSVAKFISVIADASQTSVHIELQEEYAGSSQKIDIPYHGGLQYPHLARIDGKPDTLTKLLAPIVDPDY